MGWCILCRSSVLISCSFARMRSRRVFRCSWKAPRRDLPQMKVKPKKCRIRHFLGYVSSALMLCPTLAWPPGCRRALLNATYLSRDNCVTVPSGNRGRSDPCATILRFLVAGRRIEPELSPSSLDRPPHRRVSCPARRALASREWY